MPKNTTTPLGATDDPNAPVSAEQLAAFEFVPIASDEAAAMRRDFSAHQWAAEFRDHGIALRFAHVFLTTTKEKIVETTEAMEMDYRGSGPGPTAELLETLRHSRERLSQLVAILQQAELRQASAAAVVELRHTGDAA